MSKQFADSNDSAGTSRKICPTSSLQQHFHTAIREAVEQHDIDGEQDTVWYLGNLLCDYAHTARFLDRNAAGGTLTPLAEYYRHAVEAENDSERRLYLQRLGDVALFVTGLFSGALKRRAVGVSYYISMGETAYAALADADPISSRDRALADIFADLANQFPDYVSAMSMLTERPNLEQNLLQQVEEWEHSGHPALARTLRQRGVFVDASISRH